MTKAGLPTGESQPRHGKPSRRTALGAGLIAPMLMADAAVSPASNAVVSSLVRRSEQQAKLFDSGEMTRWLDVANPGDSDRSPAGAGV